jgi:hypothetical protein
VVGVLASISIGYLFARSAQRAPGAVTRAESVVGSGPAPQPLIIERSVLAAPADSARLAGLEQRLNELERQGAPQARPPEPSPAEAQQRFEARVRRQQAEPVDPSWAKSTNSLLQADVLKQATGKSFRLNRVDCRTTLCSAELEWPSTEEADREYLSLVHFPYKANCGRTLVLPDPASVKGALHAQLLFDCESWRADGEQLLETGQD